jgi:hypothetical protein
MPQHTPGPLKLARYLDTHNENPGVIVATNPHGQGSEEIASVTHWAGEWASECPANARRLVACWNACEGIDTEALEGMRLDAFPDVLAALEQVANLPMTSRERIAIQSAIAKARGEVTTCK